MNKYIVRHKDDGISAGCWDKNSVFDYAVFGPHATMAFGEVVALFFKQEHADGFAANINLNISVWQVIKELNSNVLENFK